MPLTGTLVGNEVACLLSFSGIPLAIADPSSESRAGLRGEPATQRVGQLPGTPTYKGRGNIIFINRKSVSVTNIQRILD